MKIYLRHPDTFKLKMVKKGFSVMALGKELGISPSYSYQVMNGKRSISAKLARRICDLLDESHDELFFIENGNSELSNESEVVPIG